MEPEKVPVIVSPIKCSRVATQNVDDLILKDTTAARSEGAYTDIAACRTVIGLSQLLLYEKKFGITLKHCREPAKFISGGYISPSLCVVFLLNHNGASCTIIGSNSHG